MITIAKKRKYIGIIFTISMLISLFMIFVCFVERLIWLSIVFIIILLITLYLSMDYAYTPDNIVSYDEKNNCLVFKNGSIKINEIKEITAKRSSDFKGLHFNFGNLYIESTASQYRFKYVANVGKVRGDIIYLKHNGRLPE
jgi:hypothetical protein